jgi:hypothetical protein
VTRTDALFKIFTPHHFANISPLFFEYNLVGTLSSVYHEMSLVRYSCFLLFSSAQTGTFNIHCRWVIVVIHPYLVGPAGLK